MNSVSVIIPCYNQGYYLAEAIDSVLAQTYADIEIIVVNDGSTDHTAKVAERYADRVRHIRQNNRGLSSARNTGLQHATGGYIQFLDADDVILPTKIEKQMNCIIGSSDLTAAYCDYYVGETNNVYSIKSNWSRRNRVCLKHEDLLRDLALNWETELTIPVHSFLLDRQIFSMHGVQFDTSLPNHEDWDFWMSVFAQPVRLCYIDEPLVSYRSSPGSMGKDRFKMRKGFLMAIRKQQNRWRHDPEMIALLNMKMRLTRESYRAFTEVAKVKETIKKPLRPFARLIKQRFEKSH